MKCCKQFFSQVPGTELALNKLLLGHKLTFFILLYPSYLLCSNTDNDAAQSFLPQPPNSSLRAYTKKTLTNQCLKEENTIYKH